MSATSAVLTGLSLATGIAREATDAVPIVKQVLGVASRIVGLAEQVDKNRDDLHALADRAKSMDATITDIIGERELDSRLLRRLEDMNRVLCAVEKHFDKHLKQGRVRKTLGYILTVRKDVDRLRGEFDDRLRELEVAATLDANITAKQDSRFIGEFRNIRHSEIDLLRRITPSDYGWRGYKINCHLATCEGSNQLVVVREVVECGQDEKARLRIEVHNNILERMSLVKNRHPNIAYLYGRNTGPKDSRFVVLKAGDIRLLQEVLRRAFPVNLSFVGQIISKLVVRLLGTWKVYGADISNKDALCHLQKHGATVSFGRNIYLDNNYEPVIGIQDDLHTLCSSPEYHAYLMQEEMRLILAAYGAPLCSVENEFPCAHFKSTTWLTDVFGTLIEAGYPRLCEKIVFRRGDIGSLIPLTQESRMYLRQSKSRRTNETHNCWSTLLDLAIGGRKHEGSFLHAQYYPSWTGEHYIHVYCVEDTVDAVYNSMIDFEFPSSAANEIRAHLGIPASSDDQDRSNGLFYLQRFAGTCTGWRRGLPCMNFP